VSSKYTYTEANEDARAKTCARNEM
jgi:hypothetical protein